MGCYVSRNEETNEIFLEDAATLISSLNPSTSCTLPSDYEKQKFYSSAKFLKIKSIAMVNLQDLPNKNELLQVLDHFERDVYDRLEENVVSHMEINISIIESTKPGMTISVQAEGIRKFMFLSSFLMKMQKYSRNCEQSQIFLRENSEFIMELAPLTVNFYLHLGEEVDFGIGVIKPIDRKNLSKFLQDSNDRKTVTEWSYLGHMPIPVSLQFSCIKPRKSCNFYLFDGEKLENFQKAFAIFDYIGAPIADQIKSHFFPSKSQDAHCKITFEHKGIIQVSVQISDLPRTSAETIANLLNIDFPHHISSSLLNLSLQLDNKGLSLLTHSDI